MQRSMKKTAFYQKNKTESVARVFRGGSETPNSQKPKGPFSGPKIEKFEKMKNTGHGLQENIKNKINTNSQVCEITQSFKNTTDIHTYIFGLQT